MTGPILQRPETKGDRGTDRRDQNNGDPGKYEFYSCDQIAANRKSVVDKLDKLKLLMDKAEKGAGGTVVSVIAYKGDYIAAQDELKVIDATARDKKCKTPENWSSTSAIR